MGTCTLFAPILPTDPDGLHQGCCASEEAISCAPNGAGGLAARWPHDKLVDGQWD